MSEVRPVRALAQTQDGAEYARLAQMLGKWDVHAITKH